MGVLLPANTVSTANTLSTFLCHAVAANRAEQKTLALVLPDFVALQPAFFCDLAESWKSLRDSLALGSQTMLRVDCCCSEARWNWFTKIQQQIEFFRSQRAVKRHHLSGVISVTRCLAIGRPRHDVSEIVLGITDPQVVLPEWVKPAEMTVPGRR